MNMLDLFDDDMESESEMLKKKKKVRLLYPNWADLDRKLPGNQLSEL